MKYIVTPLEKIPESDFSSSTTTAVFVYGGLNEIGGNKIVLRASDGSGILLDFGFEFRFLNEFFDEFLPIRQTQVLIDGFLIGFLPFPSNILTGIYRTDLWNHNQARISELYGNIPTEPLKITHVLISHCHGDHIGSIRYLNSSIKIVCGQVSKAILDYYEEFYKSNSMFREILKYGKGFQISEKGTRMNKKNKNYENIERKIDELPDYYYGDIDGSFAFNIQLYPVDHSIPGACAYLLEDKISKKRIIYTGDLRLHGPMGQNTRKFIDEASRFNADLLITEGTRLGRVQENLSNTDDLDFVDFDQILSEKDVESELKKIFQEINREPAPKMIFFTCSMRDSNRLESFYLACKDNNRTLILLPKSYLFLQKMIDLNQSRLTQDAFQRIRVFLPRKGWGNYDMIDYKNSPAIKAIIDNPNTIRADEIHQSPGRFCLQMSFYNMNDLLDVRPPPGSHWIRSESEPFTDEAQIKMDKLLNWLKIFNISTKTFHKLHCSGHLSAKDLAQMITKIHPKAVLVIHSEHPELISTLDIPSDIKIVKLSKAQEYQI
ncbi:MAG: MBL fold metallo-hydrolase [Candidatus Lokiarchaeota archaeon]|nr:MBL fold metallo-hydrolase [Candidatus Harpocratesius repetitus]